MSFTDFDDAKERVRQKVDIVDLIGGYLELRRQGRGFVARCRWHDDSRPSLQVNPARQSWKCWVCDIGGDIFSFVMKAESVGFREALELLANRAGIELPRQAAPRTKEGDPNDKPTLYKAVAWAEERFHHCLLESADARDARSYLLDRGIAEESWSRFKLGFAPQNRGWLTGAGPTSGYALPVLEAAGLVGRHEGRWYDFFSGRVMFPIHDLQRRAIAFGGRVLPQFANDRTGKYLNTRETRLFSKAENLYALDIVRDVVVKKEHRHLVVVEGYTDVIAALQAGLDNVVAVLGTALGPSHVQLARRFADRVTLVLDGDKAGQDRAAEVLDLFVAEQVDLRIAVPPEGLDPCEFVQQRGADAWRALLEAAPDALDHKLSLVMRGFDPTHDSHRAHQALEEMLRVLSQAPLLSGDESSGPLRLRRQQILARLAREFQIPEPELRVRLAELRQSGERSKLQRKLASGGGPARAGAAGTGSKLRPVDAELLELLILDPDLIVQASDEVQPEQVEEGPARAIYQTCLRLHDAGEACEFQRLMAALDDPQLKSLLVELDEVATKKAEHATSTPAERFEQLRKRWRADQAHAELRRTLADAERQRRDAEAENQILLQFQLLQRQRQGLGENN